MACLDSQRRSQEISWCHSRRASCRVCACLALDYEVQLLSAVTILFDGNLHFLRELNLLGGETFAGSRLALDEVGFAGAILQEEIRFLATTIFDALGADCLTDDHVDDATDDIRITTQRNRYLTVLVISSKVGAL